ncbi:putative PHD finger domain protein [Aspergillus ruber CBS 135680]|uniref:Chromatin modification-related protein n=1 Tax=Aspergillus ruber (strain CBS 135680) TaxID=1388766 RepID=A0A017SD42_ASPRC|nr:putative PHD finger domain protein [Aspergillus ruber CBS 135680]EYE94716.1 putative PHD finger domain protein [Aspergillus ruber CBS 135680]
MTMLDGYDDDETGGVILDGPFDPDAQATVTDYIDYTEYLPADLIRSLTLIGGLDARYIEAAQSVHDLTKDYGQLPQIAPDARPHPQNLRKDISFQLDRAINARESAYAEACRLYDVVDHHFNRLDCIRKKLEALPKPSSREPTPDPTQAGRRAQPSRKKGADASGRTRITLRLDGDNVTPGQKSRSRRSVLSAEHLAFNPDSPIASTEHSDDETELKSRPSAESQLPGIPAKKEKTQSRRSRPSVSGATVSTSNALAMLRPPPEGAKPGSDDMPWLRLTEWEMTKLRKKMKKNAVWQPSEVMIHRELALRGRGWEAYRAAKAQADADGTEFVDCDDIANTYIPGKLMKKSDATKENLSMAETKLSNRGMKLNEAKKLKRENLAREQAAAAAAAAAAEAQGIPIPVSLTIRNEEDASEKLPTRASKRKLEELLPADAATQPSDETRASRLTKRRKAGDDDIPTEPRASLSSASVNTSISVTATASVPVENTAPIVDIKKLSPPPTEPKTEPAAAAPAPAIDDHFATPNRPPSRGRSISLAEQATTLNAPGGRDLRRKSATPARRTPIPVPETGPTRRRKRPAPGPVSSGQDGGAAVSYGRRKAKMSKKRAGTRESDQRDNVRIDEDGVLEEIDSNEPRYCMCGDVSFGTMICCENPDCDKEWFHLDCIGLSEVPSRTAKWFCPDCRVKFNKGQDGIVKIGSRR